MWSSADPTPGFCVTTKERRCRIRSRRRPIRPAPTTPSISAMPTPRLLFEGAWAVRGERAMLAVRFAREANAAAVPDDLMGKANPVFLRDHLHQVLLDFLRRRLSGEPQAQ